jgi:hypothetical protein
MEFETTFHLTHGEGYYENYKQDAKFSKYDLPTLQKTETPLPEQISLEKMVR